MNDLTHTFSVDATPQEAYEAIIDVRSWWGATNIVGPTDQVGADWFYLVPDIHYSKQHTAELVPGERVLLFIDDAVHGIGSRSCGVDVLPEHALWPVQRQFGIQFQQP